MKIYFKQSSSNFAAEFGLLLLLECNFWEGYCASALGRWRNFIFVGSPGGAGCKEPPASAGDISHGFNPWVRTVPRRRATHPSILAWRISWTEKPGGLQCMGSQGVGHDWSGLALSMHMRTQTKKCMPKLVTLKQDVLTNCRVNCRNTKEAPSSSGGKWTTLRKYPRASDPPQKSRFCLTK